MTKNIQDLREVWAILQSSLK